MVDAPGGHVLVFSAHYSKYWLLTAFNSCCSICRCFSGGAYLARGWRNAVVMEGKSHGLLKPSAFFKAMVMDKKLNTYLLSSWEQRKSFSTETGLAMHWIGTVCIELVTTLLRQLKL